MAHSLSAKKRARQNEVKRVRNRVRKSMVKTQTKHFLNALKEGNLDSAKQQFQLLTKKLDKVSSTSTMHKNTASRIKSRLAKRLNALAAKAG